tara:strand:+ start:11 stop:541 length:531 start_codon:yes stop_codon:yes gene_type:complete
MTQEIKDKAFQLRSQGFSYRDIHSILGVSKGSLNYWFSKDGREKTKQRTKKYRKSPKTKFRTKVRRYFDLTGITTKQLLKYMEKKSFCHICGDNIDILNEEYHIDHITPRAKGGSNKLSNMHPAHKDCNYMKGEMYLNDFLILLEKVYNYHEWKLEFLKKIRRKNNGTHNIPIKKR